MKIIININDAKAYLTQATRETLNVTEKGQQVIGAIVNSKAIVLFNENTNLHIVRESLVNILSEIDTLIKADAIPQQEDGEKGVQHPDAPVDDVE